MISDEQLNMLIQEIMDYHGYDFSDYSRASFMRRIDRIYQLEKYTDFGEFLSRLRTDARYFKSVIEEITVNVTEMFRDPLFYLALRQEVLPQLATKPFIRLWHAGCSTGEEVYSMAILLHEANLLTKSLIYATDISPAVLEQARKGVFPIRMMKQYSENYVASGGQSDFSDYYIANYGHAKFSDQFSKNMVFSQHNLVSDRSFNEFDLILCRNVLIYFDADLQERAITLFDDSLTSLGYIALGSKETMKHVGISHRYQQIGTQKIWRKIS